MQTEQEKERDCVFRPELSVKIDPAGTREVKGMDKFVERQKMASEARREKEKVLSRNPGDNWVHKTTIPKGFSFTNLVVAVLTVRKRNIRGKTRWLIAGRRILMRTTRDLKRKCIETYKNSLNSQLLLFT